MMMSESLKVAYKASHTILEFFMAMDGDRLQLEAFPNGFADMVALMIEQIIQKLEIPVDQIRLD